jgi:hypothetical protein
LDLLKVGSSTKVAKALRLRASQGCRLPRHLPRHLNASPKVAEGSQVAGSKKKKRLKLPRLQDSRLQNSQVERLPKLACKLKSPKQKAS